MRRLLTCAAVGVALALPASALGKQLVPAYFNPVGSPNPWQTMCDHMDASGEGSTAIMAPAGAAAVSYDPAYAQALDYCHDRGQNVIGYVDTGYTSVTLETAEANIDSYYRAYPSIDGIFLDEMANDPAAGALCDGCAMSAEQYYETLYAYIHQRSADADVMGNPGIPASTSWQLDDPAADAVVTFEGSIASFVRYAPPAWVLERRPSEIANLIYASPDVFHTVIACRWAERKDNAGLVYVTDAPGPPSNTWASLATDWLPETRFC